MSDYIKREDAIKCVNNIHNLAEFIRKAICEEIEDIPSADVVERSEHNSIIEMLNIKITELSERKYGKDRGMIFGTGKIKDLEQEYIGIRNCHLCGEEFKVGRYDTVTICPACRIAWRKIRDKVLFEADDFCLYGERIEK